MPEYLYKTRGNSTPKNKPRVYFTCHPDDFERYFNKICEDIFKTHDCVIYYTEDMTKIILDEDKTTDLGSMNLFVVPVTFRLLSKPNRAMDDDLVYAKKEHIAILPFMMESGIDEFYAKPDKFGELQYINPYSHDLTEIRYEEKLKKYLDSVLIGEETAKRVRAAFDAYIFLSYRKKDRRYANELMQLIHAKPEFRDIAIWYDEFLVPGESFNDNIRRMMKESKLFTLLVTPNLLEKPCGKPNYVMEHEYPEARNAGMVILPAEMEETDKDALNADYADIPECTDPYDDESFQERLIQSLGKIARAENDDDPEHNYLIGLAYLQGIDVEKNPKAGIELIEKAANKNITEACKKMVDIYQIGESVQRDCSLAIYWQRKLIGLYQSNFDRQNSEYNYLNLAYSIITLGDYQNELAKIGEAKKEYQKVLHIADTVNIPQVSDQCRMVLVSCYRKLSVVTEREDRLSDQKLRESLSYCEKALEIIQILSADGDKFAMEHLAAVYTQMGNVCYSIEKLNGNQFITDAKKYYKKALGILTELKTKFNNENVNLNIAKLYITLGDVSLHEGFVSDAQEHFQKAIDVYSVYSDNNLTQLIQKGMADAYEGLGRASYVLDDYKSAEFFYLRSVNIAEDLLLDDRTIYNISRLISIYDKLSYLYNSLGRSKQRRDFCEKEIALRTELAEQTETVEHRRQLSYGLNKLGSLYDLENDLKQAFLYYKEALKISEKLAEELGTEHSLSVLAIEYEDMGERYRDGNNYVEAEVYYLKAVNTQEKLAMQHKTIKALKRLESIYRSIGYLYKLMRNTEKENEYNEKLKNVHS